MQTEPENADGDRLRQQEPAQTADREVAPGPDAEQGTDDATDCAGGEPQAVTRDLLARLRDVITLGYGERWRFDDSPSIFELLTFVVSIVGVYFLIQQWSQTDAAIRAAQEANRIAREVQQDARDAQEADARDSQARARREERLAASTEASVDLARRSFEESNRNALANIQALQEGNVIAAEVQRPRLWHRGLDSIVNPFSPSPMILVRITNDGASAARFRWAAEARILGGMPQGPMPLQPKSIENRLAAGEEITMGIAGPPVPVDVWGQLKTGHRRIYVYGVFRYSSVGRTRETRFCWFYTSNTDESGAPYRYPCPSWNDRDVEVKDDTPN